MKVHLSTTESQEPPSETWKKRKDIILKSKPKYKKSIKLKLKLNKLYFFALQIILQQLIDTPTLMQTSLFYQIVYPA